MSALRRSHASLEGGVLLWERVYEYHGWQYGRPSERMAILRLGSRFLWQYEADFFSAAIDGHDPGVYLMPKRRALEFLRANPAGEDAKRDPDGSLRLVIRTVHHTAV